MKNCKPLSQVSSFLYFIIMYNLFILHPLSLVLVILNHFVNYKYLSKGFYCESNSKAIITCFEVYLELLEQVLSFLRLNISFK